MVSFADAKAKKGETYVVSAAADGGQKFTLCVLRPGVCDHAQIDLLIGTGNEQVTFSVAGGAGKVHVTGYEVLEETYDGFGDDDDDSDDDDDDGDEFAELAGGADDSDDDDDEEEGGQPSFFNIGQAADDSDDTDDSSEEAPPPPPPPPKSSEKKRKGSQDSGSGKKKKKVRDRVRASPAFKILCRNG